VFGGGGVPSSKEFVAEGRGKGEKYSRNKFYLSGYSRGRWGGDLSWTAISI